MTDIRRLHSATRIVHAGSNTSPLRFENATSRSVIARGTPLSPCVITSTRTVLPVPFLMLVPLAIIWPAEM